MINFNTFKVLACVFTFGSICLFTQTASAQKYKTADDTVKLNKEYGEVTLDIAKLKAKLVEEKNKTYGYQTKSTSTAQDAVSSAQYSKQTAATATDGSVSSAKKAMKQAKKANNQANDAKDAKEDQEKNVRKIADLQEKIEKKQAVLTDLDKQRADIMLRLTPAPAPVLPAQPLPAIQVQ